MLSVCDFGRYLERCKHHMEAPVMRKYLVRHNNINAEKAPAEVVNDDAMEVLFFF